MIRRNFLFWLSRKIDYPLLPPDVLQINFTFRCNLRCKMCSMHERIEFLKSKDRPYELEIPTIKKIIKEAYDMGVRSAILIGGEPFLEPRIFELVSFANDCGMNGVTAVTNGTLLSGEVLDEIFACGPLNLSISIDAATDETFARIRGENALKKITGNIEEINRRKEALRVSTPSIVSVCTIMDQNIEELPEVLELCRRLKISRVIFQPVVGDNTDQTRQDFNSSVFIPSSRYHLLDAIIEKLVEYKLSSEENFDFIANSVSHLRLIKKYFRGKVKPAQIPCYAGYNRLQVVQEGKVYFCVNQDKYESTFGNVDKDSLKDLWYSAQARSLRKIIRTCDFPCLQWCAYRDEFTELKESLEKKRIFSGSRKREAEKQPSPAEEKLDLYGFKLHEKWHCSFPKEIPIEAPPSLRLDTESRIQQLAQRAKIAGSRILELGCLEGGHSALLQASGAAQIIAIEGRRENFLKCLTVKNALNLDRCKFLLGDLSEVMPLLPGKFDICLALGILYHLEDPVSTIYRIAELSDSLFVWSHYATGDFPVGPADEIYCNGYMYMGKRVTEAQKDHTSGVHKTAFWLFEEEFIKAVKDAGFRDVEIISKESHPNGPAISFFAKK